MPPWKMCLRNFWPYLKISETFLMGLKVLFSGLSGDFWVLEVHNFFLSQWLSESWICCFFLSVWSSGVKFFSVHRYWAYQTKLGIKTVKHDKAAHWWASTTFHLHFHSFYLAFRCTFISKFSAIRVLGLEF